tara:strand:- start:1137 stop:1589 length:453 start_codon:yes stop_codon:yes gene_type:complete
MVIEDDKCFECGTIENIQYHHVVPKSKGGKNTIPLCQSCHSKVHGEKMLSFQNLGKHHFDEIKNYATEHNITFNEARNVLRPHTKPHGRPRNSVESEEQFLSKHNDIMRKLEGGYTHRYIAKVLGKSTWTVQKVKRVLMKNGCKFPRTKQ